MTSRKFKWPVTILACMGALAAAAPFAVSSSADPEQAKQHQADALAAAPAGAGFGPADDFDPRAGARAAASRRGSAVPLPEGGNFNGVRWELAGGRIPGGDIETVLEYNAACQWVRALKDGRERDAADHVLHAVPSWPALRAGGAAPAFRQAAGEVLAGRATTDPVVADCVATHEREVSYSASLGLTPST